MTDKAQVTREELMAMREVAAKAYVAPFQHRLWSAPGKREVDAYVDALYPLPAPEPQQVTGPSGTVYAFRPDLGVLTRSPGARYEQTLVLDTRDEATVANLLCPFEDVVRATLEEMKAVEVLTPLCHHGSGHPMGSWNGFAATVANFVPRILKRLESR